jgi:hypothetical protein
MSTSSIPTMEIFPSLEKYPMLCDLKSVGALWHPDEEVFHFRSLFLAMSRSYEFVLDDIAEYLQFISSAQSFWFMLNTSYHHGCHLASWCRLEPNDYEVLLVVAGLASLLLVIASLASYTARWEAAAQWEAEAKAVGRRRHDKRLRNNQPVKRRETLTPLIVRGAWYEAAVFWEAEAQADGRW